LAFSWAHDHGSARLMIQINFTPEAIADDLRKNPLRSTGEAAVAIA
jgi:hypothetical protein